MLAKWMRVATLVVITTMAIGTGMALAAPSGAGPYDALAPAGEWTALDSGQFHWYAFRYDGQEGQITVRMDVEPADGANFRVVTPQQLAAWEQDGDFEGCGCGSENKYESADLMWTGNFNSRGNYYVVVKHSGLREDPSYYALKVAGDGVTIATPTRAAAVAPAVEPEPEAVEEAAKAATADGWMALAVGEQMWFEFNYSGKDSQIQVTLDAEPDGSATFSVWTPEQARLFSVGEEVTPVGTGSEDDYTAGDLSWTGSFPGRGTYFVRVDQKGAVPAMIKLDVMGDDVLF